MALAEVIAVIIVIGGGGGEDIHDDGDGDVGGP